MMTNCRVYLYKKTVKPTLVTFAYPTRMVNEYTVNKSRSIHSRCDEGPLQASQYRLPLEEEVGAHPSLEDMQDAVVIRKLRPHIPQNWREHPVCIFVTKCAL